MRSLVVTALTSLDWVMQSPRAPTEDPSGEFELGGWLLPRSDAETERRVGEWLGRADEFLVGRGTYDLLAAHPADDPLATALATRPVHVASRTLWAVERPNAHLVRGDVVDAVRAMKDRGDGGELQVLGSAGLVQTLLRNDLVDELRLIVFPVLLGTGKRLFDHGTVPTALSLSAAAATGAGALVLTFRRTGEVSAATLAPDPPAQHPR